MGGGGGEWEEEEEDSSWHLEEAGVMWRSFSFSPQEHSNRKTLRITGHLMELDVGISCSGCMLIELQNLHVLRVLPLEVG